MPYRYTVVRRTGVRSIYADVRDVRRCKGDGKRAVSFDDDDAPTMSIEYRPH
jgi:hypothetical protein